MKKTELIYVHELRYDFLNYFISLDSFELCSDVDSISLGELKIDMDIYSKNM